MWPALLGEAVEDRALDLCERARLRDLAAAIAYVERVMHALAERLDPGGADVEVELGERVHDAFYVRDRGGKITEPRTFAEIERAIIHGLAE